jgi:hypothetical protein
MYNPPLCETTGVLVERCELIKKNETTAVNQDVEVLNDLRFIEPISNSKSPVGVNQTQELGNYRVYFDKDDDVKVGDKIYFNTINFWKKTLYNPNLIPKKITKLVIKSVEDYSINCQGYKEAVCLSYN